jgi:leucyl aminopeptidase
MKVALSSIEKNPRSRQTAKKCGVLGVGKGSDLPAKFIILEYMNAQKSSASGQGKKGVGPVVLVGKGVTFDTGGVNLKPENYMLGMNMDMSGGAAVLHTVAAIARLKVKCNLVALVPAVENMPSGSSYRPGDVLRSMSGKTIEVGNTDAEGRIILADALTYAKRYNPSLVVDVATLTGASLVALGERASALFTNDEELEKQFRELGELSGDFVWPLPLWEEYDEEIKGTIGD